MAPQPDIEEIERVVGGRRIIDLQENERILFFGANGAVGHLVIPSLQQLYGPGNIVLTDKNAGVLNGSPVASIDVTDHQEVSKLISDSGLNIKAIINLAAILSAEAERQPDLARAVNVEAMKHIQQTAYEKGVRLIYTPSSIAVLGPSADPDFARYDTITDPEGVYGQSKVELEKLCVEMSQHDGFISSALRYAGLISNDPNPANGTPQQLGRVMAAAALAEANPERFLQIHPDGLVYPEIPPDIIFPMVDGRTVTIETIRFLHTPKEDLTGHVSNTFLSDYSASLGELVELLPIPPIMKVILPSDHSNPQYNPDMITFGNRWSNEVDKETSTEVWGFESRYTLKDSVDFYLPLLVEHFSSRSQGR